jgi:protein ImuB
MEGACSVGRMSEPLPAQYVCVHVPEFPAQARLRLRAAQTREAVAILEGEPPLQTVCSVTKKAQRMGVAGGMTRAELDTFPALTMMPRSAAEERATRAALLHRAAAFTPRIEVVRCAQELTCVLDMTGTRLIFGEAARSTRAIAQAVQAVGLSARLAVSANFEAAVCAAPGSRRTPRVIPAGEEKGWLGALPIEALRLNGEQAATMDLWGVRTLAELAALPETDLVVRLGQMGKRLRALACGEHEHLMVPEEETFGLEDAIEFDEPEDRLEALLFVAGPMLDQLIARAQAYALSLAAVTIVLALDGGGEHVRVLKPALPLADRTVLLKLMNLDLQAHPPGAAVLALRLMAEPGKRGKVQMGLFSPQLPEPTRLDVTLAQIEAMVGEGRVGSPRLLDTHHAEDFAMERFVVPSLAPRMVPQRCSAVRRRLRPAVPLRVWMEEGAATPGSFFFATKRYAVAEAYGPWRQSGEWGSGRVWAREEWDVRAVSGESVLLCVIAQDLLERAWRMEAFFD